MHAGHADDAGGSQPPEEPEADHHLDFDTLRKLVRQLRTTVSAREAQLESKSKEQARLEDVTHQLMVRTFPSEGSFSMLPLPLICDPAAEGPGS